MKPSWLNKKKFVWWNFYKRKRNVTEVARVGRITSNWKVLEIPKAGINQWAWIFPRWRREACNLLTETRNWNLTSKASTTQRWTITTPSRTRCFTTMRPSMTTFPRRVSTASPVPPLVSTPRVWQRPFWTRQCSGSSTMPRGGRSWRRGSRGSRTWSEPYPRYRRLYSLNHNQIY